MKPGPIYVRNHTRRSKNDPTVSSATLLHANPSYAHVRLPSGVETTVSIRDLARQPLAEQEEPHFDKTTNISNSEPIFVPPTHNSSSNQDTNMEHETPLPSDEGSTSEATFHPQTVSISPSVNHSPPETLRRSSRSMRAPRKLEDYVTT